MAFRGIGDGRFLGAKMAALIPSELRQATRPLVKSIRVLTEQIDRDDAQIARLADGEYCETRPPIVNTRNQGEFCADAKIF